MPGNNGARLWVAVIGLAVTILFGAVGYGYARFATNERVDGVEEVANVKIEGMEGIIKITEKNLSEKMEAVNVEQRELKHDMEKGFDRLSREIRRIERNP